GDISANGGACTGDGGLLRALYDGPSTGPQMTPGFSDQYGCVAGSSDPYWLAHHGKFVDQSIYSSPAIGDLRNNGTKYIVVGSGCAFPVGSNCGPTGTGKWIKVWDQAGTLAATLAVDAPVFGSPVLADVNRDGVLDIIVATMGLGWADHTNIGGTLYVF